MLFHRYSPLWLLIVPFVISCSHSHPISVAYQAAALSPSAPNYAQLTSWAAHPAKYDPSDSVPKPYLPLQKDSSIAVFFIHPTTFTNKELVAGKPYQSAYWNAAIENEELNAKTDNSSILYQASVFNEFTVYAPRYRQAHLQAFYLPDSVAHSFFDTAYTDVKNAFTYFLNHQAVNKPFIIAAHSQGTLHAGRLIKEYIENKPLQNRLVVAYLIGLAVPEDYFAALPPCSQPLQTGCFVAWRTFKKGYIPEWVKQEKFHSIVINPVSWTMDTLPVPKSKQLGAVLYNFNKPQAANVNTQIHGNVLWSSKPRFFGNLFFTTKNYHIGDINLFWKDIRNNAAARVHAFWKK